MGKTRSCTQRFPLQTISAHNRKEKVKRIQDCGLAKNSKTPGTRSQFSALKVKYSENARTVLGVNPLSFHSQEAGCETNQKSQLSCKSRNRPRSPVRELLTKETFADQQDDDQSVDSEEELDYEKMRERNIQDNQAFFFSIGIHKIKEQFKNFARKRARPQRQEPKLKELLPSRRSLRIQRIDPAGVPLPPEPEPELNEADQHCRPVGTLNMLDVIESEAMHHASFISSVLDSTAHSCQYKPLSNDLSQFVSDMKKLCITTKAKVCKDRIFSLAIHPTTEKILAMAGDKWGRLGLWNISSMDDAGSVMTYRPHSRPIGQISVAPELPSRVYTCSYDCSLRLCHIERGMFEELYSVPEEEEDLFRSFDFLSPTSMLLAQFRGDVAVLDSRTAGQKAENLYHLGDKRLRTISVHPTNQNFFCTASSDGSMCIWDLRRMSAKRNNPLHSMKHGRAVSSAYFSPLTGNHILTCSSDDYVNIFSCSSSCGEVSRLKAISHNNRTGRWLTPFRSVWHPAREDIFFVGSMKTPRRIEAFSLYGKLLHEWEGDVLSSVCSLVQFHPTQNVLVGGNSSGYIFPFM